MMSNPVEHIWSKDALLAKAQRFYEEMLSHPRDDWRFALWSTFALELLARAALANINPVLLADSKDWNNTYYALGFQPKATKFTPRSIDIHTVFSKLGDIISDFTPELSGFGITHMSRRNEEVHTGGVPFDTLNSLGWLPVYYRTCDVLIGSMDEDIELLLGKREANIAHELIRASLDNSAKAVLQSIHAHQTVWANKDEDERRILIEQASIWANRNIGHRVICPACSCNAIVIGKAIAPPLQKIKDDKITDIQQYQPSRFECIACGLKISGLPQLIASGLGNSYKATFTYDAEDYYAPNDDYIGYEPDNNEP